MSVLPLAMFTCISKPADVGGARRWKDIVVEAAMGEVPVRIDSIETSKMFIHASTWHLDVRQAFDLAGQPPDRDQNYCVIIYSRDSPLSKSLRP